MFIEASFPPSDARAKHALKACQIHGTHIGNAPHGHGIYYCLDGKVWLFRLGVAVLLGDYLEFRYEVRRGILRVEEVQQ